MFHCNNNMLKAADNDTLILQPKGTFCLSIRQCRMVTFHWYGEAGMRMHSTYVCILYSVICCILIGWHVLPACKNALIQESEVRDQSVNICQLLQAWEVALRHVHPNIMFRNILYWFHVSLKTELAQEWNLQGFTSDWICS